MDNLDKSYLDILYDLVTRIKELEQEDTLSNANCHMCPFIIKHNLTLEDIQIFAEWHDEIGGHGDRLRNYLKLLHYTAGKYILTIDDIGD